MVTDKEIRAVIKKGALSVSEIMEFTGAGTGCGRCKPQIENILLKQLQKKPVSQQLKLF